MNTLEVVLVLIGVGAYAASFVLPERKKAEEQPGIDQEEIKKILPHREAMLLLDQVEEENGEAVGQYKVRGDEFFLQGHFPGNPIVPGVILCEMLAQSACVLLAASHPDGDAGHLVSCACRRNTDAAVCTDHLLPGQKKERETGRMKQNLLFSGTDYTE